MSKPQKTHKPMASRTKGAIVLCVMLCITVILGVLSVTGMALPPQGLYKLLPWVPTSAQHWPESISLGLDLQGGVYVEYQATRPDDMDEGMYSYLVSSTMDVIRKRLTDKGFTEATVTQLGGDGIRVEIPSVTDPNAVLDLIGSPALLEFKSPEG